MKKPWTDRFGDFMAGKGFYMVLFLCVAAIGISGYYLFSSLAGDGGSAAVSGPAKVVVTPSPSPSLSPSVTPVKPSVPPAPSVPAVPSPAPTVSAPAAATATVAEPEPSPVSKPSATATVYTWPVKGDIVDAYSPDKLRRDVTMNDWRTHAGVDIAAETGTQVKAAAGGVVESITVSDLFGTTVTIDHGNGVKSVYANLAELPTVKAGDGVGTGDVIGAIGATAKGESVQRSHLHLEIWKNGESADPMKYLPEMR